jgi:hypothetical protein
MTTQAHMSARCSSGASKALAAGCRPARAALAARRPFLAPPQHHSTLADRRELRARAVSGAAETGAGQWRTVLGSPLTKDEAASLGKVLADSSTTTSSGSGNSSAQQACKAAAELLRAGLTKDTKDLVALEGAMLVAEQVCDQS